jgi:exopolysaccharide biosynthesis polyprenyl glycosylphosphotransferase
VNEIRRRLLLNALKLLDLGLLMLSFGLSALIVQVPHGTLAQVFLVRVKLSNVGIFSMVVLAWHLVLCLCGMYGSKRLASRRKMVVDTAKATTFCTLCLVVLTIFFSISIVTPRFIGVFFTVSAASVISGRLLLRYFLGKIRLAGHNLRHILILGTNARAVQFARNIEANPELGYRILGFIDQHWPKIGEFEKVTGPLACEFGALPEFLRHNVVDEVVNYLPLRSFYEPVSKVAALCELHGIILRFSSDIFGLKTARAQAGELDGDHDMISYSGGLRYGLPLILKRILDLWGSLLLLFLLAPLFGVVALLIKLTSEGPVFFLQKRVGYNKRAFSIYKFRTMVPNAEKLMPELENLNEVSGPVFKIENDPRITPIGKFLRRTSIDELPQFINVLKGEMSLVGPRPLPVRDYQGFNEDWQRRRFSIKPGITCLWQVNGRCSITFEQWMKLDIQYLDEWSLWLDLKILARTIPAVLKGSGAA